MVYMQLTNQVHEHSLGMKFVTHYWSTQIKLPLLSIAYNKKPNEVATTREGCGKRIVMNK